MRKRPTRPTKYVDEDFEKNSDGALKCICAAVTLSDNVTHFIICAKDKAVLKKVWDHYCPNTPIDMNRTVQCLMRDTGEKVIDDEPYKPDYFWYYHGESDCCFLEKNNFKSGDGCAENIGPAIEETKDECLLLLRKMKMPRSQIQATIISTVYPDDIPF